MEYETGQYFREHDDSRVDGFTIINSADGKYHLAEKTEFAGESRWCQYWIESEKLEERIESHSCEPVGTASSEQVAQIKKLTGLYQISEEEARERARAIAGQ